MTNRVIVAFYCLCNIYCRGHVESFIKRLYEMTLIAETECVARLIDGHSR